MDNQIQNKLSQFEVQPPEGSWQRLADALDENTLRGIGNKLSQLEVLPNQDAWSRINSHLNNAAPARVIPFHRKYAKHLKYGSAVAVFAAVALVSNLLISKKTGSEITVPSTVKNILNTPRNQQQQDAAVEFPVTTDRDVAVNETAPLTSRHKNFAYTRKERSELTPTMAGLVSSGNNVIPQYAHRNTIIAFNEDSDRYMAYSMDNGNAIKLPKKMYDAITCPTKDANCLQKIKQLQEKMAASALLADFTGVLDILNNLGENQ